MLWMESTVVRPTPSERMWRPVEAASAQNQCEQQRDAKVADFAKPNETVKTKKLGAHTLREEADDLVIHRTFVCLPDTVDPRGPKGR